MASNITKHNSDHVPRYRDRRLTAFLLAAFAGILLVFSGTRGPTGIYQFILQQLPNFITDQFLLSIANTAALIFITISLVGGFIVLLGGFLIYINHVTVGKIVIGLGAGAGIPWLIMMLATLATNGDISTILTQHSIIGWIGIILAFAARIVAK